MRVYIKKYDIDYPTISETFCREFNRLEEAESWCRVASGAGSKYLIDRELTTTPSIGEQTLMAGYHIAEIEKQEYGSLGKISEEVEELVDAYEQGSTIMVLVELSDLYGAIEGFLDKNYPNIKMSDLSKFSQITKRAFESGERK